MCVCLLSHFHCVQLSVTLWTVAWQSPLSMGFSRHAYWSRFPCPLQGSSQTREQTQVSYISCLDRQVFTTSATREARSNRINVIKLICWSLMFEREFPLVKRQLKYLHRWLSGKKSSCQWRRHWVCSLGQEDALEQEMATHSSILAWKIP